MTDAELMQAIEKLVDEKIGLMVDEKLEPLNISISAFKEEQKEVRSTINKLIAWMNSMIDSSKISARTLAKVRKKRSADNSSN